ncbi:MAG: HRDC domain-containing protein [Deltaproteobacteria bacterium]|nr:HRDC domain-containing protein [Deltaproteobacteria bacterium]
MNAWIRTPRELEAWLASLVGCHALALDTESDSLYHHVEKVCLIQVAPAGGEGRLIDPLFPELQQAGLAALAPLLADPAVTKVLHGADYDVATLKRDFGFSFAGLFDTMLAARFLGRAELGLAAVARAELGVELTKGGQKDDWSRRPLTARQEQYALADVQHLGALHDRLRAALEQAGRLTWVLEECDAVAKVPAARRRKSDDAYLELKGASRLPRRALAVLRELFAWREARAEVTNIPPFKIAQNELLLALALAAPTTPAALAKVPAARHLTRDVPALLEGITRALALPEAELPRVPAPSHGPRMSDAVRRRIEALRALRTRLAKRLELDISVVLPQRLIDRIAEAAPKTLDALAEIDGVRRWRTEILGEEVLASIGPNG